MLYLVQGPAGSGKSQVAASMMQPGMVIADITRIWAAIFGIERDPDTGRYPVRDEDDARLALYIQGVTVRQGLREGRDVVATTSRADQVARWEAVADQAGVGLSVTTVDPGIDVVRRRLADPNTGVLSDECEAAISRWYP